MANEFNRLYGGFNRELTELTPEKLAALYDAFGGVDVAILRAAVSRALLEGRLPSGAQMRSFLQEAEEAADARRQRKWAEAEKRVPRDGLLVAVGAARVTLHEQQGLKLYQKLCIKAWDNNITPQATAQILRERLVPRYPFLAEEIAPLEAMGLVWRNAAEEPREGSPGYEREAKIAVDEWRPR